MKDFIMNWVWEGVGGLSLAWMSCRLLAGISGWLLMMPLTEMKA